MSAVYILVSTMLLGDAAWWRWADGRLKYLRPGKGWRFALALFMGGQIAYMSYFIFDSQSARRSHAWLPIPVIASAYIWHLLVMPVSLVTLGLGNLCVAMSRLIGPKKSSSAVVDDDAVRSLPTFTRRQTLAAVAVAAPPLLTAIAVGRALPQLNEFRVRSMHLKVAGLPRNLDGLRIAHVSDTHIGRYTRKTLLPRIVEATNHLRADLILFTGDLIDLSLEDLDRGIAMIRQMDPRHGLFMIEGNHDLIENADAFDARVKAAGLPLLIDETQTISLRGEKIQISGARWGTTDGDRRRANDRTFKASVARLMPMRDPAAFPILLAHHPHAFDAAAAAGLPLTLSGHTHGGQLMLSEKLGAGPVLFRYWSGLYRKGASQLIVSNGVGNWFPLRVQAPAEIIDLTLHC